MLLSDVIYAATQAKAVLVNAWKSLARDGLVIIRGYYADPDGSRPLMGALFAVKQVVDDAREKMMTCATLKASVTAVGFEIVKAAPLTEFSFVLVGRKP